ncbi:Aste57867_1331 [Aphanomyces stellatus]|uniref:Aste57867_1331 protein n=1 Tax=Aphanomyces stellatus TaxID=120398 RepID=A0A485K8A5_9STRA|nr:hypothetical protein As57867_001330 [Aphanomyces stellatus]VFT78550.1 Aste57867_1331 [Aphanomyces stellatus]
MATPEKKKQASIASFFSPISRSANPTPSASASPTKSKASSSAIAQTPPAKSTPKKATPAKGKSTPKSKYLPSTKDNAKTTAAVTDETSSEPKVDTKKPQRKKGKTPAKAKSEEPPCSNLPTPMSPARESNDAVSETPSKKQKIDLHQSDIAEVPTGKAAPKNADCPPAKSPEQVEGVENEEKTTRLRQRRTPKAVPVDENQTIVIDDEDDVANDGDAPKFDGAKRPREDTDNTSKKQPRTAKAEKSAGGRQSTRKKAKVEPEPVKQPTSPLKPKLSIAQQQKYDLYHQKLTDTEDFFVALVQGEKTDEVMQEIYGAALDIGLGLSPEAEATCREDLFSACDKPATPWAFPSSAKSYIARRIQGRMDSLSALAEDIFNAWKAWLTRSVDGFNVATVEMEIKSIAERVSYGAKPKKAHMFQDVTPRAMWVWEVGSLEGPFDEEAVKVIRRMRKQRKRTGQTIKSLDKIVTMIQEGTTDDSKLSVEESKVSKFIVAVEQEQQKASKKVELEKQKATEKELKHQQQLEKDEAKRLEQELKRKEKEEVQAQKKRQEQLAKEKEDLEILKRRQTWGSFLKKSETKSKEEESREQEAQMTKQMETIDKQLGLGQHSDEPRNPPVLQLSSQPHGPKAGSWTSQRKRHPGLGVMKLLQFEENFRPAYWGTHSKKSRVLRRGRRPLAMVPSLDYTVESDLEWDEDEVGESLSDKDSDDEQGDEEDRLDYGDQWLAYEDEVDYIDERPTEDLEGQPATTKKKVVEHHHRPSKLVKLIPRIVGPNYAPDQTPPELKAFTISVLLHPNFESPLLKLPVAVEEVKEPPKEVIAPIQEPPVKPKGITTWLQPKAV